MSSLPLNCSGGSPPVLSGATGSSLGPLSASATVSTTTGSGTLYWVISTSATPPSSAQIQAGNDSSGSAAAGSGNQAVSSSGTQSVNTTAILSASTTYYSYFTQVINASPSNVSGSSSFSTPAQSLIITPSFQAGWAGAPAGATAMINQLCNDFGNALNPNTTVSMTWQVDFGNAGGGLASTALNQDIRTYSALRTAYQAMTNLTTNQSTLYSNLPVSDPCSASHYNAPVALEMSLGLTPFTTAGGITTFSNSSTWDTTKDGTTCGGAAWSMYKTGGHELTEVLGRTAYAGTNTTIYQPVDFMTYSASNTRNFSQGGTRYVSPDSGTTAICYLSLTAEGDPGDLTANSGDTGYIASGFNGLNTGQGTVDPYGTYPIPGGHTAITNADWRYVNLVGWPLWQYGKNLAGL